MGLELWFKEDIKNVLLGLAVNAPRMGLDYKDEGEEFQAGYKAALEAVAVSFGIMEPMMQMRPQYKIVQRETPRLISGNGRY